jgi:hypothetical protein
MANLNKGIRLLPIIGIAITLIGYFFLTFQTYQLNERKIILKNEIAELEGIKTRLTIEAKEKDTIITIQDKIISQSKDMNTVEKGAVLRKKIKDPIPNYFTKINKENSNIELAEKFEIEGFNYLLNKDVDLAILSFRKSENSCNGYHQVYEIAVYLNKNKDELKDKNSNSWDKSFQKILKDYSWKMPDDIKTKMIEIAK